MKEYLRTAFLHTVLSLSTILSACLVNAAPTGLVINIDQAITPPVHEHLLNGIEEAQSGQYDFIIIQLDTPGGLYSTTREIGQAILTSPVPIITYVSPAGARAASAGTFILYASHIAAMAPTTHLGAATPISLAPSSEDKAPEASQNKIMEDTRAYMRSLAQHHNRNQEFGLSAINNATSLTAQEALKAGAIEVIAENLAELCRLTHNRPVKMERGIERLNTEGAQLVDFSPSLKQKILFAITDPNITYLLLMAGIYGLMIELFNPGSIIPGVIGAICLLIAGYSLHILPINYAGLGLIFLGVAFLVTEAILPSFGIFGFAGIVALSVGSFFLFEGIRWAQPSLWFMGSILLALAVGSISLIRMNIQTHRRQPVSGLEGLVGKKGLVIGVHPNDYSIRVQGEIWSATSDGPLEEGQHIEIIGFDGLTAHVKLTQTKQQIGDKDV
ncbi:MAG: nodulation protein NfeD [Pseudomonadota bacterium]|nr:nodulation protein NfeD [Pseudomonadota bacterium]